MMEIDEIHDLPDNGEKTQCWLAIRYSRPYKLEIAEGVFHEGVYPEMHNYHYTINGCYMVEYL